MLYEFDYTKKTPIPALIRVRIKLWHKYTERMASDNIKHSVTVFTLLAKNYDKKRVLVYLVLLKTYTCQQE